MCCIIVLVVADWRRERGGAVHEQASFDQGYGRHHPTGKVHPHHLHPDVPGKSKQCLTLQEHYKSFKLPLGDVVGFTSWGFLLLKIRANPCKN